MHSVSVLAVCRPSVCCICVVRHLVCCLCALAYMCWFTMHICVMYVPSFSCVVRVQSVCLLAVFCLCMYCLSSLFSVLSVSCDICVLAVVYMTPFCVLVLRRPSVCYMGSIRMLLNAFLFKCCFVQSVSVLGVCRPSVC